MAQEPVKKDPIKVIREQAQARGIDPDIAVQIARAESTMDPTAKSKTSSAGGLFQITNGTWKDYGGKPGMKFDVDENVRVGLNILEANTKRLRKSLGREPNITELYAAHFLGSAGGPKVMMADRAVPVDKVLSAEAMQANPTLKGKTVGEVVAILDQKMGVKPQAAAKPTPAAPMPASAAGAPKRVAEAPAAAPVVAAAEAVAPVAPKAADMGAGYQAALALSFLGDEEDKAEKDEGSSAAKMMAAYKPYNALKDFDLGPSIFAQLPLTPGQAQAQPQQPKMMADGGEVDLEDLQNQARKGEAYRQMEQYLKSRDAMPDITAKVLPEPTNAVFTALKMPLGRGTIKVHKDPEVLAAIGPSLMAHELAHAVDRQMRQQASEQSSVFGGGNQFTEAYDKLVGRGPFVSGKKRVEFARQIAPEWASFNKRDRASPEEIAGHAVGAFAPGRNMQDPAPPHVDATAATEFQILLDLAQRNANKKPTGLAKIPNFLKQLVGFADGGEVAPPVYRQEGSPETGEIAPEVQKFQTNSSPDDLLANRVPYRSAAEQLAYLEAANPKVFINNKPMREGVSGYVSSAFPNVLNIAENLSPAQDEYVKLHEMEHSLDFRGGDILGRKGHGGTDSAYRAYYLLNKNWKPVETLVENVLSNKDKLEKFFGRPMQDYLNVKPETVNKLLQNPSKLRSLFGEQIASLSALEQITGKSLTRDPEMRDLFPNTQMMSVYDALTGLRQTRLDARDLPPHTPLPSYTYAQNPIIRAIKKRTFGPNEFGIPVKRQEGSPETGEVAGPTPEELEAASRPAFLTPKSGIGRKQSMTSGQVNDAVLAGVQQTPYNLLGAPVDLTALAMTPFGYSNPTPVMGSEWIKKKMTEAGVRPATPTQPTARALYEMGQFGAGLVNPAAPVRGAVAAGQAGTRAARDLMQDFQSYNRELAAPGASYAVKPKGGEFAMERPYGDRTDTTLVHPVDRYLSTSEFSQALGVLNRDAALETWVNEKLGRYMRRDMASPDDQFVKAADEGKPLHFMQDGQPRGPQSFSNLPYIRKIEGFNPQGEARTPYGKQVENQVDMTVEPLAIEDFEGIEYRLPSALQGEVKTNPSKRVYELQPDAVTDYLQFPGMVDAMRTVRNSNGMFKAYGQSVPIPKEFQFSDETLKGLSPAQASERLARYINWSDSARQKAASIAIAKNPRISTTKMEGGYTWVRVPDVEQNPEILDLVKDVGCAGQWCTEQPHFALRYGSGENRLHILMDKGANPKAQITVSEKSPNPDDFVNSMSDAEYDRFKQRYPRVALYGDVTTTPEYNEWALKNPITNTISEIKGKNQVMDLKNSPILPSLQNYVKQLDKQMDLKDVENINGIGMVNVNDPREITQLAGKINEWQGFRTHFSRGANYITLFIKDKNGGSKFVTKEDHSKFMEEGLTKLFGPKQSPVEKAHGGMVERRKYL